MTVGCQQQHLLAAAVNCLLCC
jgi:hypothetical protein